MTGKEAVEYIHSVSWLGSRPGLERIGELLEKMGNPQKALKCIHVAGTNGKGSVCAMLSNILKYNEYKTGLFTSPYVLYFNERIQINGEMISDDKLGEVTEYVKSFADLMEDVPTEFEILCAVGFEYFKREGCDYVVLETGLGGRLDSTNVIESPVLSVITGIDLDHTAVLGDTVAQIAFEKSGIIKKNSPVVLGDVCKEAYDVIKKVADERASTLYTPDYDDISFEYSSLAGSEFVYKNKTKYALSLIGEYQIRNALVVLKAVEVLNSCGVVVHDHPVKMGLETARWPARFELISKNPIVIYDGAHNPQGVAAACRNIRRFFGSKKVVLLTGVMADKDHSDMTSALAEVALRVHTVKPNNPRAMEAGALAMEFASKGIPSTPHGGFDEAVEAAIRDAIDEETPLVALGSLYMYADVLGSVKRYTENN